MASAAEAALDAPVWASTGNAPKEHNPKRVKRTTPNGAQNPFWVFGVFREQVFIRLTWAECLGLVSGLGNGPVAFPIFPAEQPIGLRIVEDFLGGRIELQRPPDPSREVPQVTQRS